MGFRNPTILYYYVDRTSFFFPGVKQHLLLVLKHQELITEFGDSWYKGL